MNKSYPLLKLAKHKQGRSRHSRHLVCICLHVDWRPVHWQAYRIFGVVLQAQGKWANGVLIKRKRVNYLHPYCTDISVQVTDHQFLDWSTYHIQAGHEPNQFRRYLR